MGIAIGKPRRRDPRSAEARPAHAAGWSLYGAPWLQPAAISGKSTERGNGGNTPKPLPWVATGCLRRSMVSRASAVGCHPLREVPSLRRRGSICRRCGGALRQPLARHVHCCTIMQDLIIARAPNRLDARKKTAGRQYDAPLNARPRCGPRRAPTAPISSPRRSLRRLRAEGVVEERNQALLVFARSDVDAAGV